MNLKDLLGDAYKDGMSFDEISAALQSKNLVDLSAGGYVDVNKYNREVNDLKNQITAKDKEIQTNATKASGETNANQQLIADLQEQLKNLSIESNRSGAIAASTEAFSVLGLKAGDAEYEGFISNVSNLDKQVSNSIVTYFNKQVKAAYEKGKVDGTKNSLGDMGKQRSSATGAGAQNPGDFGKKLAQSTMSANSTFDYFARNK